MAMRTLEFPIGEIGRLVTGRTPSSDEPWLFGADHPFITPSDISDDFDYVDPSRRLSRQGAIRFEGSLLPPNAVCFSLTGTIGKMCLTSELSMTNQQITSVVVDETRHDFRYFFHVLRISRDRIRQMASGVKVPTINKTAFSAIRVPMPSLETQAAVASILGPYDGLLENARKRAIVSRQSRDLLIRELLESASQSRRALQRFTSRMHL